MKFTHPIYKFDIDTESPNITKAVHKLNDIYKKIPRTKCLVCPGKDCMEAQCCKHFSPPILLVEFLKMLRIIDKWPKEKQDKLLYRCFESVVEESFVKQCVHLDDVLCEVYDARPLSCRLFGMYSDEEWEDRLKRVSIEIGEDKSDVPMSVQCRNLEIEGKTKTLNKALTDKLFLQIHYLDISLFPNKIQGKDTVMSSYTYMPFDMQYLCIKIGPDNLEKLTDIKIHMRNMRNKLNRNEITIQKWLEEKKNVGEVLSNIRLQIFPQK